MATLVFGALGTVIGGPLGGAVGSLVGRQVDAGILAGNRQGPRLKELAATTSSYGMVVPRHFGRMRVAGTVIWSTELVEHAETGGTGKGAPSLTTYSYTASFAVVLSSRPILRVGRIWADGNLLRGEAGDLKCAGTMRVHSGRNDQAADPLIAAAEGESRCPAYRGLAYVVFEDLALADFYNRLPTLTFEVFADDGELQLGAMLEDVADDAEASVPLKGLAGFSAEGSPAETLQMLDPLYPVHCDASTDTLRLRSAGEADAEVLVSAAASAVADDAFAGQTGHVRRRTPDVANPLGLLRYYDVGRDYLPGTQRAVGASAARQPGTVELPAAMSATAARDLIEAASRRLDWSRQTLAWRTAELDPAVGPGSVVKVPGQAGRWLVTDWEWRESGVEFLLVRLAPGFLAAAAETRAVDAGRPNLPADLPPAATSLVAFELPWDGNGGGSQRSIVAALSSAQPNWKGAALFVDRGEGNLRSLGPSGRTRSTLGTTTGALEPASPLFIDQSSRIVVALTDPVMELRNATAAELTQGYNRALIGDEIVQFARATALGDGHWRLECLLRGCGGTEAAVATHAPAEPFVLLDGRPVGLDPAVVGESSEATIVAVGLGDVEPVTATIRLRGRARLPLSPVHPRARKQADGALVLEWTRRARGAWLWQDGAEVPLVEGSEAYLVTFGPDTSPQASWTVSEPRLILTSDVCATLAAKLPHGRLAVRQVGDHGRSDPLVLATLP